MEQSSNKSWRITALLFLAVAALAPAIMVGWVNAKQDAAPAATAAPVKPDWYRGGETRAPWEGPAKPKKAAETQSGAAGGAGAGERVGEGEATGAGGNGVPGGR